ncbi:MAG: hypothetical protein LBC99_10470 [Spirochaetota bacterium]|jgi:hypothetical protein|nr:hypothetical protein [Spirochaetota bacterium]
MRRIFEIFVCLGSITLFAVSLFGETETQKQEILLHTALYFAALPLEAEAGSSFYKQTLMDVYPRYRENMEKYWRSFRVSTFDKIRAWQGREIADLDRATILYPFSGPDFLNVYAVYPDADTYIMIGLEMGGLVPRLEEMPEPELRKGLAMMVEGFRIYIGWNFYRTLGMADDLDKSPFTGTLPHVLTQLAWLDAKPLSIASVRFTPEGEMIKEPLQRGEMTRSWVMECRASSGRTQRIIYLCQDISNEGLRGEQGVKRWLEALPPVSGLFKAASYLPPRVEFSEITRICLDKMKVLVQDDSGIPYRMLKSNYDVTVYGWYVGPHRKFPSYGQPDLAAIYRASAKRSIEFNFQYDRPDKTRNLMVARRKAEN